MSLSSADAPSSLPTHLRVAFRHACTQARFPLALAGAGLSAASGIPTFRGSGPASLWRQHDPLSLATPQAFRANPSQVWQFYHWRRELCLKAKPNSAHHALSWLSTEEGSRKIFPGAAIGPHGQGSFRLVTQNVDGLSKRANIAYEEQTGVSPPDPVEMHGSLFRTRCLSCNDTSDNFESPIAPALRATEDLSKPIQDLPLSSLPHCSLPSCQTSGSKMDVRSDGSKGLLRPAVVWFGESIPLLDSIEDLIERCDLLLVLGTSSTVYPAAGFASQVRRQGGRVAVFNVEAGEEQADWEFIGKVEETLPWVLSDASKGRQPDYLYL